MKSQHSLFLGSEIISFGLTKPQRGEISQPRVEALGMKDLAHLDFGGIVAFFATMLTKSSRIHQCIGIKNFNI